MFDTEMWYKKLDDTFFDELMDVGKLSTKMVDIEMELMKPQKMNFTKSKHHSRITQEYDLFYSVEKKKGKTFSYHGISKAFFLTIV